VGVLSRGSRQITPGVRTQMTREFDCAECGRHIISFGYDPGGNLCGVCLNMPGWFRDKRLRDVIDPEHDGKELMDKEGEKDESR
jgi:hypothetical protein